MRKLQSACLVTLFFWLGIAGVAIGAENTLQQHMQHMLNNGDQWRTPNPGHESGDNSPSFYGLTFLLSHDGSHATGKLTGVYPDGREAVYWSLLALYNPVTERVVTQQIGWDGTLIYGEVPVQTGPVQIVDMISYGADGTMSISRHENRFVGSDKHTSLVFARGPNNDWEQKQTFEWTRHGVEKKPDNNNAPAESGHESFDPHVDFLLTGSGQWRAPNPDYKPGGDVEQFYGMNYRWGPHRRYVIGEIVSIYSDGRTEKDWSLYITHNPVTGKTYIEQTGARGVYFRGEFEMIDKNRHAQQGLIYLPNGTVKSVRDQVTITGDRTYKAEVFERDTDGSWKQARKWTWTRVD